MSGGPFPKVFVRCQTQNQTNNRRYIMATAKKSVKKAAPAAKAAAKKPAVKAAAKKPAAKAAAKPAAKAAAKKPAAKKPAAKK